MHSKSAQRKPAKHKKTSGGNVSKPGLVAYSKKNNLEAKKERSGIQKGVTTLKSNYISRH